MSSVKWKMELAFLKKYLDATWLAPRTSFAVEHIARAADSLPAAGEPVWYPCHAGSRRAEAPSILFSTSYS
jgi:hypothetical protein